MGKDADQVQTQCGTCQLAADRKESYAVFVSEDWRTPFIQYLVEVSCHKDTARGTNLRGWQRVTSCTTQSFLKEDIMETL